MVKLLSERTRAEMARGALVTKRNMAEGLVEQIASELDPHRRFTFYLISESPDPRNWGVKVNFNNGASHAEDFSNFPTDELKAKIMLMS